MSKKILIVEDFCDLRELLGTLLTAWGWNPILAESGRDALDKLNHETPSVILMDMGLPDMNGFELATILKKHRLHRSIPLLATTALLDDMAGQRCLSAGCDDFISKPFAIAALASLLANLSSLDRQKPMAATGR